MGSSELQEMSSNIYNYLYSCILLRSVNLKCITDDKEMSMQIHNCEVYFLMLMFGRGLNMGYHNATVDCFWSDNLLTACVAISRYHH